jgi:hypothetical protein
MERILSDPGILYTPSRRLNVQNAVYKDKYALLTRAPFIKASSYTEHICCREAPVKVVHKCIPVDPLKRVGEAQVGVGSRSGPFFCIQCQLSSFPSVF